MNEANITSDSSQFFYIHISIFQGKFNKRIGDKETIFLPLS